MPTNQECESCELRARCIYSILDKEQRLALQTKRVFSSKKKDTVLFQEGFPAYAFFMVKDGLIKYTKPGRSDLEIFIDYRKKGDLAGLVSITPNSLYPVSATCLTNTTFCAIPSDLVRHFGVQNRRVAEYLLMMFGEAMLNVRDRIVALVECSTQQKVARALLLMGDYIPDGKKGFELKREELANLTNSTRETVSRVLGKLKREKIIAIKNSEIQILKPMRLSEIGKV